MAIEKVTKIDKIEIVGDYKHIQVRERTDIVEDGVVLSSTFERWMVTPTQDTSNQPAEVQAVANLVHTQEVKDAYIAHDQAMRTAD